MGPTDPSSQLLHLTAAALLRPAVRPCDWSSQLTRGQSFMSASSAVHSARQHAALQTTAGTPDLLCVRALNRRVARKAVCVSGSVSPLPGSCRCYAALFAPRHTIGYHDAHIMCPAPCRRASPRSDGCCSCASLLCVACHYFSPTGPVRSSQLNRLVLILYAATVLVSSNNNRNTIIKGSTNSDSRPPLAKLAALDHQQHQLKRRRRRTTP